MSNKLTDQQLLEAYCAYLPYGVEAQYKLSDVITLSHGAKDETRFKILDAENLSFCLGYSKLLLTPMSECMNNEKTARYYMDLWSCDLKEVYEIWKLHDKEIEVDDVSNSTIKVMNRNGIDYMDLIELGYAVDKTKIK
jgi:hypothetical protein